MPGFSLIRAARASNGLRADVPVDKSNSLLEPRGMRNVTDIIAAFGGATRLARLLHQRFPALKPSRDSVYMWPKRGIPARWHVPLLELGRDLDLHLTAAELLAASASEEAA